MSTPAQDIFSDVVAALAAISRVNGFATEVELVRTGPVPPGSLARFPALVAQVERVRTSSLPARRRRCAMRLRVTAHVRGADEAAARHAMAALLGDIDRALLADPTRGARAALTEAVERTAESTFGETGVRAAALYDIVWHETL